MPGIEPGAFHMQSERSTTELHPLNTHSGQGGFSDIFTWSHGKARWLSTKVWRHRPSRLPWGRECLSDHFWGNLCDGTCFFQRAGRKLLTGTYKDGWGLVVYLCWLHRKFVKKKKYWLESKSALSGVGFEPTPGRPDCDLNAAPWTARPSWLLPNLTTNFQLKLYYRRLQWSKLKVKTYFIGVDNGSVV